MCIHTSPSKKAYIYELFSASCIWFDILIMFFYIYTRDFYIYTTVKVLASANVGTLVTQKQWLLISPQVEIRNPFFPC